MSVFVRLAVFGGVALVSAMAPAVCVASTVALADETVVDYGDGWGGIDYRAAAGESNHVVLTAVDDLTIGVSDPGAAVTPGPGCRSIDAHTAICSAAGLPGWHGLIAASVETYDMDDIVDSRGPGLSGNGGPGNDVLQSASVAAGVLNGGGGRDTLLGGTNADTLIDGDRSDAADADVLDGREGGAIVSYVGRTAPVLVDLADPGPDGERGEGDVLRSVSGVTGGAAADELRGDDRPSALSGGPGRDRLEGLAGADSLDGGRGSDRLSGSAGNDWLAGGPDRDKLTGARGDDILDGGPARDRLLGGAGSDELWSGAAYCGLGNDLVSPSAKDYVARDCEQMRFGLPTPIADSRAVEPEPYPYSVDRGSLAFRVRCPHDETDGYPDGVALTGQLSIRALDGRLLGHARIPPAGRACARADFIEDPHALPLVLIRVELNAAGLHLQSRGARIVVAYSGRNVPPVPWSIRLRR